MRLCDALLNFAIQEERLPRKIIISQHYHHHPQTLYPVFQNVILALRPYAWISEPEVKGVFRKRTTAKGDGIRVSMSLRDAHNNDITLIVTSGRQINLAEELNDEGIKDIDEFLEKFTPLYMRKKVSL